MSATLGTTSSDKPEGEALALGLVVEPSDEWNQRSYKNVKKKIDTKRTMSVKGAYKRPRRAAQVMVEEFEKRGQFYRDGEQAYYFLNGLNKLVRLDGTSTMLDVLLNNCGVAPGDCYLPAAVGALRLYAIENGMETTVHTFSYYDLAAKALYAHDFEGDIYKITADAIDRVRNGTDGVLFLESQYERYEYEEPDDTANLFRAEVLSLVNVVDGALSKEEYKDLLELWCQALFFPELFGTKPIVALVGGYGSGKTTALKLIGRAIFGPKFNVMPLSNDGKDFDVAVTNAPFVAIDNCDQNKSWLDDKLAVVATGGTITKRILYTTNQNGEFPIRAFVALTSRTPYFRREDVADRLLLFHTERFEQFTSETGIFEAVEARRDEIMSSLFLQLQEIVARLAESDGTHYPSSFRMADFADFALRIADGKGKKDEMESMLQRLTNEQMEFAVEESPLADALDAWLRWEKNHGIEVTAADLYKELMAQCELEKMDFFWCANPSALGQLLSSQEAALVTRFRLESRVGGGRRKYYRFWPKEGD